MKLKEGETAEAGWEEVMVCSELVGVAGNYPRIVHIDPLEYRCIGESHKDENCAIRRYIIAYGWATHIWSEAGNNNPNLLRSLGRRCGIIIQTEYGELIQFEKPLILWMVCNSTISGLQQKRCGVNISNTECPICKCNNDDCCKQNCMWWVAFRLCVIREALIPSNKGMEMLKTKVEGLEKGIVRNQPNNLLDLWLDRYRWLEDAYGRFYYICDLKNKLQSRNSIIFLKIVDAEDVSCIKLNRNDFEYYDPSTGKYIPANSFFRNPRQKLRITRGELIQVRRINNKGDEYVKRMI